MAHKALKGGTAYEITGGKTMVNGTVYGISAGKALVSGTVYDVVFGGNAIIMVSGSKSDWTSVGIQMNGSVTELTDGTTMEVPVQTVLVLGVGTNRNGTGTITINGTTVFETTEDVEEYVEELETYYWTIPKGVQNVSITQAVVGFGYIRHGEITITTS